MLLALSLGFMTSSCDEAEGRITVDNTAPAQVSNLVAESGPGEFYLSWTNPTTASFMYTKVVYTNGRGEEKILYYSKEHADDDGKMNITISGFATTNPVDVDIYACSVRGNCKSPVTVTATPGAPAFDAVATSVKLTSDYGGARVHYVNETAATLYLEVSYTSPDVATCKGSTTLTVGPYCDTSQFISFNYGSTKFLNGENASVTVYCRDAEENASVASTYSVGTKKVMALDKSLMSFPGYDDSSNDATIGYSSQEAGGEGASPNGRVIAMIDNSTSTFWHTAWKTESSYPHFFILDLGQEVNVTNMDIRRRSDNSGTMQGMTFYTCTGANAEGSNPDAWKWTTQGWFSFNPLINNAQRYRFDYSTQSTRYIKVYFAETDAYGSYVMISNIEVYTPDE